MLWILGKFLNYYFHCTCTERIQEVESNNCGNNFVYKPENLKIYFKKCTGFYAMEVFYVLDLHKCIRMHNYASYKYFLVTQKTGVASLKVLI